VRVLHEHAAALVAGTLVAGTLADGTLADGVLAAGAGEPPSPARIVAVHDPVDSALVLGSSQSERAVDLERCRAAGVDVVRRRSGGGAVLVEPGSLLWVDLVVPAGDPLWSADVGRATWWVGEAWRKALARAGLDGLDVWRGPMVHNQWSSLVCFAGRGPGEVVDQDQSKVVGISQRRTRRGALFQCACILRWEPRRLLDLLALPNDKVEAGVNELARVARGVAADRAPQLLAELLSALPGAVPS
jgi:lipoate---protein ligase